jgi:hypothetical protein
MCKPTTTLAQSAMLRRLEDRIRELCAKSVLATDAVELHKIREQLRDSAREYTQRPTHSAFNPLRPERRAV